MMKVIQPPDSSWTRRYGPAYSNRKEAQRLAKNLRSNLKYVDTVRVKKSILDAITFMECYFRDSDKDYLEEL